jgi:hypothetical protein
MHTIDSKLGDHVLMSLGQLLFNSKATMLLDFHDVWSRGCTLNVAGRFNFGPCQSDITITIYEIQIEIYQIFEQEFRSLLSYYAHF